MLGFDLISTKMPFGADKSVLNTVKTTGGDSENHILMLLLPTATVFGLFFTQLEQNFGTSCLVLT